VLTREPGASLAVGLEVNTWQGYSGRKSDNYNAWVELPEAGARTAQPAMGGGKFIDFPHTHQPQDRKRTDTVFLADGFQQPIDDSVPRENLDDRSTE